MELIGLSEPRGLNLTFGHGAGVQCRAAKDAEPDAISARPCVPFWERLGFALTGGDAKHIIITGWGCEVNLIQTGEESGARAEGSQSLRRLHPHGAGG
jgi:hypothetical protein